MYPHVPLSHHRFQEEVPTASAAEEKAVSEEEQVSEEAPAPAEPEEPKEVVATKVSGAVREKNGKRRHLSLKNIRSSALSSDELKFNKIFGSLLASQRNHQQQDWKVIIYYPESQLSMRIIVFIRSAGQQPKSRLKT